MRYALLLVAGCGFKGASLGSLDAEPGAIDTMLAAGDAAQLDALVTATDGAIDGAVDAAPPDAMIDAAPPLACPAGGQKIGDAIFYFSSDQRHFSAAETACEAMGSTTTQPVHLAVPKNKGEAMQIASAQPQDYEWIGVFQPLLSPGKDQNWKQITGGAAFIDFAGNEPNDGGGAFESGIENFAQMYGHNSGNPHGSMNDTAATDNLYYICECDGAPADPATLLTVPFNL